MGEWTIGDVVDTIAEVVGDRPMTVCGERTTTYAEMAERTRRLANFLAERDFGAHCERDQLDGCIGCGCLSLEACPLRNPDDIAAQAGPGARLFDPTDAVSD